MKRFYITPSENCTINDFRYYGLIVSFPMRSQEWSITTTDSEFKTTLVCHTTTVVPHGSDEIVLRSLYRIPLMDHPVTTPDGRTIRFSIGELIDAVQAELIGVTLTPDEVVESLRRLATAWYRYTYTTSDDSNLLTVLFRLIRHLRIFSIRHLTTMTPHHIIELQLTPDALDLHHRGTLRPLHPPTHFTPLPRDQLTPVLTPSTGSRLIYDALPDLHRIPVYVTLGTEAGSGSDAYEEADYQVYKHTFAVAFTFLSLTTEGDEVIHTSPVNLSRYLSSILGEEEAFLAPKLVDIRTNRTDTHPMLHGLLISVVPHAFVPDPWRVFHVFDGGFAELGKAASYEAALLILRQQRDLLEERLPFFDAWTSQVVEEDASEPSEDEATGEIALSRRLAGALHHAHAIRSRSQVSTK